MFNFDNCNDYVDVVYNEIQVVLLLKAYYYEYLLRGGGLLHVCIVNRLMYDRVHLILDLRKKIVCGHFVSSSVHVHETLIVLDF